MKIHRAIAMSSVLSFGVFALIAVPALAASGPQPMQVMHAAGSGTTTATMQMKDIDAQVRKVEQSLPTLTRHEVMLKPRSLAAVTDARWTRLHAYAKGDMVERLKVYPPAGSSKTEEFYYNDGKLIMVFQEPNGAAHEGHNADAQGTRYYFNANGLFAMRDGQRTTHSNQLDTKQKAMGAKLQRESSALLGLADSKTDGG